MLRQNRHRARFRSHVFPLLALAALTASSAWGATATVDIFTGGDPGEGLDMQGNFTYAVNVGPNGAVGKVGDANFTADTVAGVTVSAGENIGSGGWLVADFGETENDNNLEAVLASIRWSNAANSPSVVTVQMRVEQGVEYKLQILQGENCCPGRGFNILLNDELLAENFMPGVVQSPGGDFAAEKLVNGAVISYQFIATTNNLVLVLSGPAAPSEEITDRNAILNGFTLERLSPFTDVDNDGLRDDWEASFFGDTSQSPDGDFDSDGVTNGEEFTLQINPANSDTDGDGLSDGDERNIHKSDPAKNDTDGDGLRDGAEVLTHKTDPTKRDTDGDTFSDYDEVRLLTDPTVASSVPRNTKVSLFTGGDTGEGLDLQGTFVYALDHGVEEVQGGPVGDANFTSELVDGVTVTAGNRTGIWNSGIVYGDTQNDVTLADVMSSISWSAAGAAIPEVTAELANLTVGTVYKLQLLFAEQAWPRGFDVYIDDMLVMDDFSPTYYQGGGFPLAYPDDRGVVITHEFVARTNSLRFIVDGNTTTTPEFTDHNAIINASTLERIGPAADTDNDGLPDLWEMGYFGNLDQTGTQDTDGDGLTNATEFADGTHPGKADADGDGLNDAQEKAAGTKPGLADTDRDGLSDSAEINTYSTNPLKADTDDDGLLDAFEIAMGGDPTRPFETVTTGVTIAGFTGGDAGEGLDLDGTFQYAFSILPNTAATGKVRDAVFTSENVPGVTVLNATSTAAAWYVPDFGETENDNNLERIVGNIRHGGGGANITLANLVVGRKYKLQLMFGEQCCSRGMDVFVDGKLIADEFAPFEIMGEINNPAQAAAVIYEFTAAKNTVVIQTLGSTVTTEHYTDRNPIINAVTLEDMSGAPILPPAPSITNITRQNNGFSVAFTSVSGNTYTLQYKARLSDPTWSDVTSAVATGASSTLSDTDAAHQGQGSGFWRVRGQ
jgi:hypothetical protein